VFYTALKEHGLAYYISEHPNATEDDKTRQIKLIEALPDPSEAPLVKMLLVGLEGARGCYENYYSIDKNGMKASGPQTALYDLRMLYRNKDPDLSPLLSIIYKNRDFTYRVTRIYFEPKMSHGRALT
jgi:hypothetical protein